MLDTGAAHKQITAFRTLFLRIFTPKTPLLFPDSHYTSPLPLQSVMELSSMDQTQQNHDKSYEMPFSKSSHSFKGLLKDKNTTTSSNKGHTPCLFSLCRSFIYAKARAGKRTQVFQPPFWLSTQYITSFHSQKGKNFLTSRVLGAFIHNLHLQVLLLVILPCKQAERTDLRDLSASFSKILQFNAGVRQFVKYPKCP